MLGINGDLWDFLKVGAVICITTNGVVKHGRNIMGRGVAKDARDQYPDLDLQIGTLITTYGNRCFRVAMDDNQWTLVTFPTKHHWLDPADPKLIVTSAYQLVEMADKFGWAEVILPQPGTGNGGLKWENVEPLLIDILDNRFTVVSL